MVVECTINVGFHSNFGTFRQSGHSKIPLRSTIINGFRSTQPTIPKKIITNLVVYFLKTYGKCWVPVRLETAPTGTW